MKILLSVPGNWRTVPMSKYVVNAFNDLGHEVTVFNYQYNNLFERVYKRIDSKSLNVYKNRALLEILRNDKIDLFFSIYGHIHTREIIETIKKMGVLTVSWWLNDPFQLPFGETDAAPFYDYYFSNSRGAQNTYRQNGVNNINFLPVGIDNRTHRKIDLSKKYDVVFVGDHHAVRELILEQLIRLGIEVKIVGPWKRKVRKKSELTRHIVHDGFFDSEQMVHVFNEAKIVLNIHTWLGKFDYGINPRLFEAAACGSFQLTDFKEEIPEFFENGKSIVIYENVDDLAAKIQYYLKNDVERERIANAAFEKAALHTYLNRIKRLLEVISGAPPTLKGAQ